MWKDVKKRHSFFSWFKLLYYFFPFESYSSKGFCMQ
nr:MAG TPA: hypothetical protein [Caudoviricetes sp.]